MTFFCPKADCENGANAEVFDVTGQCPLCNSILEEFFQRPVNNRMRSKHVDNKSAPRMSREQVQQFRQRPQQPPPLQKPELLSRGEVENFFNRREQQQFEQERSTVQRKRGIGISSNDPTLNKPTEQDQDVLWHNVVRRIEHLPLKQKLSELITWWSKFIDRYDVVLGQGSLQSQKLMMYGNVVTVETLFGDNVRLLHEGTQDTTARRERFMEHFARHVLNVKQTSELISKRNQDGHLIKLEDLVGDLDLYKDALKEERDSKAYRNAVVMLGVKNYSEESVAQDWTLPKHFIVGGSSGAGKTFGTRTILRLLIRTSNKGALKNSFYAASVMPQPERIKFIVSVDGGDARAASQIRKMVLQCALVLGYKGIEDLHKHSSVLEIKDDIKSAAFAQGSRVHVVEPRTFSDITVETYGKVVEDVRRVVFCYVHMPSEVIQVQGDRRAWYDLSKPTPKATYIEINNSEPGCESKAYSSSGLELGAGKSSNAIRQYLEACESKRISPLVVRLDNIARVEGKSVIYDKPSLAIYHSQLKTSFDLYWKYLLFRTDKVEWAKMTQEQQRTVNNKRIENKLNNTKDSTVITVDPNQGAIFATDFDVKFFSPD